MKSIHILLLLLIPVLGQASELTGKTRFAGKMLNQDSIAISEILHRSPVTQTGSVVINRLQAEHSPNLALRSANHLASVDFEIFDAWISLSGDLDNDGFFHNMRVTFDADVSTESETVYAKVYLSHAGGNWYQVAHSDLFQIYADSAEDSYEILTELIDGYVPGYYEVLIELHSLYHPGIVASKMLSTDVDGYGITLEDQQYDDRFREAYYYETEVYGSGSISWVGLLMLAGLVYFRFHSVRK